MLLTLALKLSFMQVHFELSVRADKLSVEDTEINFKFYVHMPEHSKNYTRTFKLKVKDMSCLFLCDCPDSQSFPSLRSSPCLHNQSIPRSCIMVESASEGHFDLVLTRIRSFILKRAYDMHLAWIFNTFFCLFYIIKASRCCFARPRCGGE